MYKSKTIWDQRTLKLTKELHQEICLDNKNWHKFRANKRRRTAELVVGALSQIVNEGNDVDIKALLKQALNWLEGDITDTGCKGH